MDLKIYGKNLLPSPSLWVFILCDFHLWRNSIRSTKGLPGPGAGQDSHQLAASRHAENLSTSRPYIATPHSFLASYPPYTAKPKPYLATPKTYLATPHPYLATPHACFATPHP